MPRRRIISDQGQQRDHAELRKGRTRCRIDQRDRPRPESELRFGPFVYAVIERNVGGGEHEAENREPEQYRRHSVLRDRLCQQPQCDKPDNRRGLPEMPVKSLVEFQNIERPPEISVPYSWRCPERENDDRRKKIARCVSGVSSRVIK